MGSASDGSRILLVDPHRLSLLVLGITLEQRGYVCECVENADDSIPRVTAFRPDVVIYDWRMQNGLGLPARLRAAAGVEGIGLSIIALSTQAEPEGFRETHQVDAYLVKPYDLACLLRALARARDRIDAPVAQSRVDSAREASSPPLTNLPVASRRLTRS